jgi:hypothetical protein
MNFTSEKCPICIVRYKKWIIRLCRIDETSKSRMSRSGGAVIGALVPGMRHARFALAMAMSRKAGIFTANPFRIGATDALAEEHPDVPCAAAKGLSD